MVLGYIYVLKQMEEAEKKGSISFNEISRHLKMSTQQLKGLLEIMEGMGHVEKVTETFLTGLLPAPAPVKIAGVANVQEKLPYQAVKFTG